MSNHNETAQSYNIQKNKKDDETKPNYLTRRIGAGVLAGSLLTSAYLGVQLVGGSTKHGLETIEKAPTINELVLEAINDGPDDLSATLTHVVQQGEIAGMIAEDAAAQLSAIDNLGVDKNQQAASFVSGQYVNETIDELTGGAMQAENEIITWRDTETNLIVSAVDKTKL